MWQRDHPEYVIIQENLAQSECLEQHDVETWDVILDLAVLQ